MAASLKNLNSVKDPIILIANETFDISYLAYTSAIDKHHTVLHDHRVSFLPVYAHSVDYKNHVADNSSLRLYCVII